MLAAAFQQDVAAIGGDAVGRHAVLDHRVVAARFHRLQHQPGEVAPAQVRQQRLVARVGAIVMAAMLAQPQGRHAAGNGEDQQCEKQGRHAFDIGVGRGRGL